MQFTHLHYRTLAIVLAYVVLRYFGGSFGQLVLYPVTLFVTFLHEMGHALGAILTGGDVSALQINPDGSGYTVTRGGSQGVILMGGYVGSAVLGNVLFYIGAKARRLTQTTLIVVAVLMVLAGVVWFESLISTLILFAFAGTLYYVATRTSWDQDVLMFFGLAAVLYIIQDFNTGPKSDLARYEQVVGILPAGLWMYVWLGFAGSIFIWNLRQIFGR